MMHTKKPYKDYKTPFYAEGLGDRGSALLADAPFYVPVVFKSSDSPEIDTLGINGALSCIGILGRDPISKTILVFHMKEPSHRTISFALLKLLMESKKVPKHDIPKLQELLNQIDAQQHMNEPTPEVKAAYDYVRENSGLSDMTFTLNNTNPRSIPELLSVLSDMGIPKKNIAIDIGTEKMLMSRETGELCVEFDVEMTKYKREKTQAEVARENYESLLRQQEANRIAGMVKMTPLEKYDFLCDQDLITVNNGIVSFHCKEKLQKLFQDLGKEFFDEVLEYAAGQEGVTGFEFTFHEPLFNLTHMELPTMLINILDRHPNITTLKINTTSNAKTSYLSMFSQDAGNALKEKGTHLQQLEVQANTRGRQAFQDAAQSLKLASYEIKPIEEKPSYKSGKDRLS